MIIRIYTGPLGGALLRLDGNGFANATMAVLVDGEPCITRVQTNVEYLCRTPAFPGERLAGIQVHLQLKSAHV